jgi:hypothetical protein
MKKSGTTIYIYFSINVNPGEVVYSGKCCISQYL